MLSSLVISFKAQSDVKVVLTRERINWRRLRHTHPVAIKARSEVVELIIGYPFHYS